MVHAEEEKRAAKVVHMEDDEERRRTFNERMRRWREFWHRMEPATAPVPNETARVVHLVSAGAGEASLAFKIFDLLATAPLL